MKKWMAFLLACAMLLSMTACASNGSQAQQTATTQAAAETTAPETTAETTAETVATAETDSEAVNSRAAEETAVLKAAEISLPVSRDPKRAASERFSETATT